MFYRAVLLLTCLLCLNACAAGSAGHALDAAADSPPAPASMERLPDVTDNSLRGAMIAGSGPAQAGNLLAMHPTAVPAPDGVKLHSSGKQSSWVLWGWYGLSPSVYPEHIRIKLATADQQYHVLLADFATRRWQTCGPLDDAQLEICPRDFADKVLGHDGTFYVAILAADGNRPQVQGIELLTSNVMEMPSPVRWTAATYREYSNAIRVSWEAAPLSSDWTLIRSRLDDPADTVSIDVDCCSYLDLSVEAGVAYHYRVQNGNSVGTARPGPRALGMAGTPGGLTLHGALQYDDSHPAAGIELQLGNGALLSSTLADGSFSFRGLSPGMWTLWRVDTTPRVQLGQYAVSAAVNDAGTLSLERGGTPQLGWHWIYPPGDLRISASTDDSITLKWDAAERAGSYEVYRSRFTDPYWAERVAVTELTSIALLNQGNGRYYYWVRSHESFEGFTRVSALGNAVSHLFPDKGLLPDTIYVIPDRTEVRAGETVTFTVFVNETAHPLNFVNSVRLTFDEGNEYVSGSFNPGSIGGLGQPDGIWAQVNPQDGFLPLDAELLGQQDPVHGRVTLDFNVTPLGGQQISNATGELFNFRLRVYTDITMSFQTQNELLRTYYSDATQVNENTWTHDDNMGMPTVRIIN